MMFPTESQDDMDEMSVVDVELNASSDELGYLEGLAE